MKVLHLIGGKEIAGSKNHLISLLKDFNKQEVILAVLEKGQIYEEAVALGIDVRCLAQKSRYDFSVLSAMKNLIKSEGISIVHTHGPRANIFGYILSRMVKLIWTTTVHSDPRYDFLGNGFKGRIFTKLNLFVLKRVNHCFAISSRFSKMLRELDVKCPITTIYNGISFEETQKTFYCHEDFKLTKNDFVMIMVGRLHPIKGHVVVFEAIKNLKEVIPNLKLLIVGDGPLEDELKSKVAKDDLDSVVCFLGLQPEEKIDSLLKLSNVLLLSSYSESFPLVVLEAARAKKAVIATDVGGVKDLITDASLGWVIPPKNVEKLEAAIVDAFQRREELPLLGENLYKKAASNYSINQLVKAVATTYRELLGEKENSMVKLSKATRAEVNLKER